MRFFVQIGPEFLAKPNISKDLSLASEIPNQISASSMIFMTSSMNARMGSRSSGWEVIPSSGHEPDPPAVKCSPDRPARSGPRRRSFRDLLFVRVGPGFASMAVEDAFAHAGLDWRGHVEVDARYFRPAEVDYLCADASKAGRVLGWEPAVTFDELVRIMVEADIKAVATRLKGGAEALQFAVAAEGRHS